ncbi:MAG: F0F1 ATP synthase subunit alpha, partial [Gemmatimonadota bacterium]
GHLDDVEIKHIRQWETDFLSYLEAQHRDILETIKTKKVIDDALKAKLELATKAFKPLFRAE